MSTIYYKNMTHFVIAQSWENSDRKKRFLIINGQLSGSFLCYRIRVSKDTLTFIDFCLYLENLTRIFLKIRYLENL